LLSARNMPVKSPKYSTSLPTSSGLANISQTLPFRSLPASLRPKTLPTNSLTTICGARPISTPSITPARRVSVSLSE
jgi:hypothetical protein